MKELSIEEKAKAYDEAIKRLEDIKTGKCQKTFVFTEGLFDYIFPELCKSEDERIRKGIIRCVVGNMPDNDYRKKYLAWLEKQGEQKQDVSIQINPSEYINNMGGNGCYLKNTTQKPTDNAEPKFKVGDIVKHKDNPHLTYILKRFTDDGDYEFHAIGKDGNEGCTCFSVVKYQDEWELVEQKPTVEMKTPEESLGIDSDTYNKIVDECVYGEQNPADKVKPFDKYEGLTDFERTLADICIGWIGEEPGWKQYIKDNADVLLKIAIKKFNSVQDALFEQNPAWSEEDERMFNSALWHVKNSCDNGGKNSGEFEVYNWLKDLKDRVQPKQEWKRENTYDLTDFENVMMHIGSSFFGQHAGLDPNDTNAIKQQANILLELASSKEWSKEDETNRDLLYNALNQVYDMEHNKDLSTWINKRILLCSQQQWKPSDEQIEILDMVLTNESMDDNIARILRELREQLEKL